MTLAVIQARMGSTRLPGKVLRPLGGRPVVGWVIRAALEAGVFEGVVVATTTAAEDDDLAEVARGLGAGVVRGDTEDVLSRFVLALDTFPTAAVARLTSDCPLLDPAVLRAAVGAFAAAEVDYLSTVTPRSLPRGLDAEVVSADALRRAAGEASGADRAHVTSHIYRHPSDYRVAGLVFAPDASDLRVTLDAPEDAALLDAIVAELGDPAPSWREVVALLRSRPDLVKINAGVVQKELSEG